MWSRPISRARATFLAIDRPRVATVRPLAMAASAICWTRWMWLAKQAVMIRLSVWSREQVAQDLAHRCSRWRCGPAPRRWWSRTAAGGCPGSWAMAPMRARSVHRPSTGREVELEVARVQDHALGRVEGGGEAVGHRVGDGDELAVEGPDPPPLAVGHRDQLGAVEQARLLDAVAGQAEGEGRPVDRERQVAQQERQGAHVVLVAVGEDAASTRSAFSRSQVKSGRTRSTPGISASGNISPQSRMHDAVVLLDAGAVAADLAEAAEEGDADGAVTGQPTVSATQVGEHLAGPVLEAGGSRAHRQAALADGQAQHPHHGLGRDRVGGGVARSRRR